tara:strand:+ start:712 stop:1044 length:333 start_codon:yes stop_codon:yes gene_type:complete
MKLKEKTILENINYSKQLSAEGLRDYILDNDILYYDINRWISIEGLFTERQICIEIKNTIYTHFVDRYTDKNNKSNCFIDWIIIDWIEHLLDIPGLIKLFKEFKNMETVS